MYGHHSIGLLGAGIAETVTKEGTGRWFRILNTVGGKFLLERTGQVCTHSAFEFMLNSSIASYRIVSYHL